MDEEAAFDALSTAKKLARTARDLAAALRRFWRRQTARPGDVRYFGESPAPRELARAALPGTGAPETRDDQLRATSMRDPA